jgi:hypothetical protein
MLTIKDGQFIDAEGNIVPPKIGDRQQIEALNRQLLMEDGVKLKYTFDEMSDDREVTVKWKCGPCKQTHTETYTCESIKDLIGTELYCDECLESLIIDYNEHHKQLLGIKKQ